MKLDSVKKSDRKGKKYVATFTNGKTKAVHFGATGYEDFTTHKDPKRKELYLKRHKKNESWNEPTTAGSLSKHLLWGQSTSLKKNIQMFKKKFNL